MKNTRSRRPDHVGGMGGDVCEPPNPQPEARSAMALALHKLSQEGREFFGSPVRRIHIARKNPLSAHRIGILRAQKRVKLVLFGCRVLRHGKGTKKIRENQSKRQKNMFLRKVLIFCEFYYNLISQHLRVPFLPLFFFKVFCFLSHLYQ